MCKIDKVDAPAKAVVDAFWGKTFDVMKPVISLWEVKEETDDTTRVVYNQYEKLAPFDQRDTAIVMKRYDEDNVVLFQSCETSLCVCRAQHVRSTAHRKLSAQ